MKIIFIAPNLDIYGGNLVMMKYAQALSQRGHRINIMAPGDKRRIEIPPKISIQESSGLKNRYLSFFSFQLNYLPWIVKNIPRDAEIIIPIYSPFIVHAIVAKRIHKMNKAKILPLFQDCREMIWAGRYIFWLLRQGFVKNNINQMIVVSNYLADLIRRNSGIKPIVVRNAVEHEYFYPREIPKENYLLFVGRRNISKGFPYLIRALKIVWKEFPDLKVRVVSPERTPAKNPRIEHLQYQGDRKALGEIYAKALIYVNASIGESFTLPPLEAMACGTACVLTNTSGIREYAQRNKNCLVVPIKNPYQMACAIIKLVKNPAQRKKLEQNGPKTSSKYNWSDATKKFCRIIES